MRAGLKGKMGHHRASQRQPVPAAVRRPEQKRSGPISRVLSLDGHLSRACVAAGLERATRARGGPPHSAPICVCSGWGLPSRGVADALVRSYRTVSAFLPAISEANPQRSGESSFLWHFPSGRPAQPLAGILPCGARTFLLQSKRPPDPLRYGIVTRRSESPTAALSGS